VAHRQKIKINRLFWCWGGAQAAGRGCCLYPWRRPSPEMTRPRLVPPPRIRQLHDLTRYRWDLATARTAEKQPAQKLPGTPRPR